MEEFLTWLKDFWTLISTPGTQMPVSTTITVLVIVAACVYLFPAFAQWRAYRRQNPANDPKEKAKQAASRVTGSSKAKSSGKKKKKK